MTKYCGPTFLHCQTVRTVTAANDKVSFVHRVEVEVPDKSSKNITSIFQLQCAVELLKLNFSKICWELGHLTSLYKTTLKEYGELPTVSYLSSYVGV